MTISNYEYPKPAVLKWAMLVVLLDKKEPMAASDIDKAVAKLLSIPDPVYYMVLENGKQYVPYRLGWERTKSKKLGYIEKIPNGPRLWQLTEKGKKLAGKKIKLFK